MTQNICCRRHSRQVNHDVTVSRLCWGPPVTRHHPSNLPPATPLTVALLMPSCSSCREWNSPCCCWFRRPAQQQPDSRHYLSRVGIVWCCAPPSLTAFDACRVDPFVWLYLHRSRIAAVYTLTTKAHYSPCALDTARLDYIRQEGYVFTSVCLPLCLLTGLLDDCWLLIKS